MGRRLPGALGVLTLATLAFSAGLDVTHGADTASKNVLVLFSERHDLPAIGLLEQGLHDGLDASSAPRIDWFSDYFDFARFSSEEHEAGVVRYLRERYADRRIDLIMDHLRSLPVAKEGALPVIPVGERAAEVRAIELV